jgi:DHA2 family multidrug resistance protein
MSLLFVPLTTISMDAIPREKMGNATSLFNLMRNIGGSIGIAVTGTLLARHSQATTNMLGANVTAYDQASQSMLYGLRQSFMAAGADAVTATARANAALFGLIQRQATMVSFVGVFQLLGVLFIALIPLVLLMKRPRRGGPATAAH